MTSTPVSASEPSKISSELIETGPATAILPVDEGRLPPIPVFGTPAIRETFDGGCLRQARNARSAPGVSQLVLNPDAHVGYGAPVGCVLASPTHIYPGPVGVDIKCSMSLLQLDVPEDELVDRRLRRALIQAILQRTPTGAGRGRRQAPKGRDISLEWGRRAVTEGAVPEVCEAFGIPTEWAEYCEDSAHFGHDGTVDALKARLDLHRQGPRAERLEAKYSQFGSYGGGNHFGECEIVRVDDDPTARLTASAFGLQDGHAAFLSHCGSRGFGHEMASGQFRALKAKFEAWNIPLPGNDPQLVYAPLGSPEADAYLDDMALGANFATLNHLLINALVLEAFQEILPGTRGRLVYFISHNIARPEPLDNRLQWVHRKGATRAFPAGHPGLKGTPFYTVGHPILLPGNPQDGSAIMVAKEGAKASCYSVNHGAGRILGRKKAIRTLDQGDIDRSFDEQDILTNCRRYPRDEAPAAYKDFNEVLKSVELADLARTVARLQARFVIKDGAGADD